MARYVVDLPCYAGTLTGRALLLGHIGKVLETRIQFNQPRDNLAIVGRIALKSTHTLRGTS